MLRNSRPGVATNDNPFPDPAACFVAPWMSDARCDEVVAALIAAIDVTNDEFVDLFLRVRRDGEERLTPFDRVDEIIDEGLRVGVLSVLWEARRVAPARLGEPGGHRLYYQSLALAVACSSQAVQHERKRQRVDMTSYIRDLGFDLATGIVTEDVETYWLALHNFANKFNMSDVYYPYLDRETWDGMTAHNGKVLVHEF